MLGSHEEIFSKLKKIIHRTGVLLLLCASTVQAQQRESNEVRWRGSIESDIRNGAAPGDICSNAQNSLKFSDDVSFKDWAYGVTRKYCPEKLGQPQVPPGIGVRSQVQTPPTNESHCELKIAEMNQIQRGEVVRVIGNKCSMVFNSVR